MLRQTPSPSGGGLLPGVSSPPCSPARSTYRQLLSPWGLAAAAAGSAPCRRALLVAAILLISLTAFMGRLPDGNSTRSLRGHHAGSYHSLALLATNISLPAAAAAGGGGGGTGGVLPAAAGELEIWARGPHGARLFSDAHSQRLSNLLNPAQLEELRSICGRCLYHTLLTAVSVQGTPPTRAFVSTGDIDDMWLRDSAVQLAIYLPRLVQHPGLKPVMAAAIRTSAYYILQDPYANAFSRQWRPASKLGHWHRVRGRGGWVAERKYELDSGAYFLNLLWNYYQTPGLSRDPLHSPLRDPMVMDAVLLVLKVWSIERHHEEASSYRFVELPREGLGSPVGYTGMVWSAFRPSDDASVYGYNIPGNMYAAGALTRMLQLNRQLWQDAAIQRSAEDLLGSIKLGLERHAVVTLRDGQRVYAYEVDGLGGALVDFDDPNLPSLLAMPLLGYDGYNQQVYHNTRTRIWGPANPYYIRGAVLEGMGSPHTPEQYIWPLANMVRALTSGDPGEQAALLAALLQMQCGDGLMHESVHASRPNKCTRPHFEWANAMLVVLLEQLLGWDCELAAQEEHMRGVQQREQGSGRGRWWWLARAQRFDPLLYERLEDAVIHSSN